MLKTPLTKSLLRTTDNYIKALEKAGIKTVGDMLRFFPRDYEDRTQVLDTFSLINLKEKNTILVTLVSIDTTRTSGNKLLTKAIIEDKNGFLAEAVWFNRKYLAGQLKMYVGKKILLSGKVKYAYGKVSFNSPDPETDLTKISGGIVPIYSDAQYIPGKWIESKMGNLEKYITEISENLPEKILEKYNFISRKQAFYKIHFPKNSHDVDVAKARLAYEELYKINYTAISKKHERFDASQGKSLAINLNADYIKEIFTHIPFELTDGQKVALFQVLKDMEKPHAMQRLLEGDVGTGKTIVSLVATIHAIKQSEKLLLSTKPHLGISSPQGVEGYNMRQGYAVVPRYVKDLSKQLREKQTPSEEILWKLLRNRKFYNLKFRRQHAIGRYIADFYCDEKKLIIELDGKIHEKQKEYDNLRDEIIIAHNLQIIRIKNEELGENVENIYKILEQKICGLSLLEEREFKSEVLCEANQVLGNSKIQVAVMAPTEILARQHFASMEKMLIEFGLTSHLLVGSTTASQKKAIKADLKAGNVDVVIGTHALVQEDVYFSNLGFVIIDEQHRFGVKQREVLEKGWGNTSQYEYRRKIIDSDFEDMKEIIFQNQFKQSDIEKEYYSVIKKNGEIIGFCRIYPLKDGNSELGHLWIHHDYRGKKIGHKIMSYAIKNTVYKGGLYLSCDENLQLYYESIGFEKVSTYPERFQDTIDWSLEEGKPYVVMILKTKEKLLPTGGLIPHNLNMTATPIPRTLALTLYGDQDLSIISEYPKGRKEIHTKVAKNDAERRQIELFIRSELEKGRQVFWISPLVEESEKIDLANAVNTYESLVDIFSPFQVGLLHGKMKAKEKEQIMKDFSDNKIQVLSSTSVVEVGVDVPNSTIMCIEGAERFGLSQLHQFRGRVGRGQYQSYCYLFPTTGQPTDRLRAMERTNNGFELSEIDLEIRGPGEVYGVRQSGLPDLKVADITDLQLVSQIREDIEEMFEKTKK